MNDRSEHNKLWQSSLHLIMIEPVDFGFNEETAVNNTFQEQAIGNIQIDVLKEFNQLVFLLRNNKVNVTVVKDTSKPHTPDSIFPNNWISFHEKGRIILYPMFAQNRRMERKLSVLDVIEKKFRVEEVIDLSDAEHKKLYLEGTGSLVLDRVNRVAYACISPRTHLQLVNEFCRLNDYTAITFNASDNNGIPIYHTNVMMCIADEFAVICVDAIIDRAERENVIACIKKTNKEIVEISFGQLHHFAGNMLQVRSADNELLLVMSTQAYCSLSAEQVQALEKYNRILHSPLNTIESAGGGSARCMMAEVFLELNVI